jgi:hypothetical protein
MVNFLIFVVPSYSFFRSGCAGIAFRLSSPALVRAARFAAALVPELKIGPAQPGFETV